MKFVSLFTLLILSAVLAEKYAMLFGTAELWFNYSITSVNQLVLN